jgi:predicted PurR-regulated permease PerM
VPAVFFAYTDSPWKAVAVGIMYIVLQQIENHIVAPQVMKKAVGLNPIVVITVMLIGAKIAGIAGILLAVPATTIIWIFVEDIFQQKRQHDNTLVEPTGNMAEEMPATSTKPEEPSESDVTL